MVVWRTPGGWAGELEKGVGPINLVGVQLLCVGGQMGSGQNLR